MFYSMDYDGVFVLLFLGSIEFDLTIFWVLSTRAVKKHGSHLKMSEVGDFLKWS